MGSSQPEQDDFVPESPVAVILEALSRTQFACTELTPLPSGTTNYVYRGTLKEPVAISFREKNDTIATELQNTIIVKRLEPFVRVAPALKLDPIHGVS